MLIVLVCVISGLWIMACLLRRRYIRKKEKEFEMRPPVAWGPHQLQAMTGGYQHGDGVVDSSRGDSGGHSKEARVEMQSESAGNTIKSKRESKALKKQRT